MPNTQTQSRDEEAVTKLVERTFLMCLVLILMSSCTAQAESTNAHNLDSAINELVKEIKAASMNSDAGQPFVRRYDVYQQGATTIAPDAFSLAMADNPITARMVYESQTQDTYYRAFYVNYLVEWKDELGFSIENLKRYLSDEEASYLDEVQLEWERNLETGLAFDNMFISENSIMLGTQYSISQVIYRTDQYQDRVFHIKYLTYLIENTTPYKVPESEQLWNTWLCTLATG